MCHWRPFAAGRAARGAVRGARRPAVGRVDATNIGRGVSVDDPKDESLLVLARAGDRRQVSEVFSVLNFLKSAVDDASANQRTKISAIYIVLLAASALVWIWALIALEGRPTLLGTAFLAYVLGLRHAVDADHIATIDNVVRKLMQEGKRPYSVGLFFSLGHSLSIALAVAAIAAAAFALQGRVAEFKEVGSIIGTGASAFFLLTIAAINLVILRGVWQSFLRARRGEPVEEQELDLLLSGRGLLRSGE